MRKKQAKREELSLMGILSFLMVPGVLFVAIIMTLICYGEITMIDSYDISILGTVTDIREGSSAGRFIHKNYWYIDYVYEKDGVEYEGTTKVLNKRGAQKGSSIPILLSSSKPEYIVVGHTTESYRRSNLNTICFCALNYVVLMIGSFFIIRDLIRIRRAKKRAKEEETPVD